MSKCPFRCFIHGFNGDVFKKHLAQFTGVAQQFRETILECKTEQLGIEESGEIAQIGSCDNEAFLVGKKGALYPYLAG